MKRARCTSISWDIACSRAFAKPLMASPYGGARPSGWFRSAWTSATRRKLARRRARSSEALGGAGLAGLVNNAGIVVGGMLEFLPLDALRRQLEVNVIGQVAVTQAFLPSLRKAQGRIVNIGSLSGLISSPFSGAYCASKFALEALTDALRMELRPWKIHVSIVEPGFIQTPIVKKSLASEETLRAQLPAEALQLYGASLQRRSCDTQREAAKAVSTEVVVKAVVHALTARRPRTRYVVGAHSRLADQPRPRSARPLARRAYRPAFGTAENLKSGIRI